MDALTVARVVWGRRVLRQHDRWTPVELQAHQKAGLEALRNHAIARSPLYARLHRGLEKAPLEELPVVTKSLLMERWDEAVTDRDVRRADVEAYLARGNASRPFRGRYRVTATGGTTGEPGVFLSDAREWLAITLTYARAQDWAGAAPGPTRRIRAIRPRPGRRTRLPRPDALPDHRRHRRPRGGDPDARRRRGAPERLRRRARVGAGDGLQVVEEGGALRVLLAQAGTSVADEEVASRVTAALARVGAHGVAVEVERVASIPRTAIGKAPLVVRRRPIEGQEG